MRSGELRTWVLIVGSVALLFAAGLTPDAVAQPTLYGFGPHFVSNARLLRIDPATGAATPVGTTGLLQPIGIAFGPDGKLYTINMGAGDIYTIDLATGAATAGARVDRLFPEGGMQFHPRTGVLYAASGSTGLLTIDPATGRTTELGPVALGLGERDVSGIAFDSAGSLYAIHTNVVLPQDWRLARVNPATGVGTDLGPLPALTVANLNELGVVGFDIDPMTNLGYVTNGSDLFTLNLQTLDTTRVGSIGLTNVSGLAVFVPEPSLGMAALAVAAVLSLRRRRAVG